MKMKKDDLQTIGQIHLLNQKNALKNSNKMAKWKGLDIRSAKRDDNYGASNIVLPCPGS